ncbi:MAG: zinc-dependent metalloprotease [Flavobacteriales bacterium]|nr:zinc-dependent metalloprotease [Flavobacteriales bacterium]
MQALRDHAFAPDAFLQGQELLPYLQHQRRGWSHWSYNEDPQIHDRILFAQERLMDQLLHPNTLRRKIDAGLYGDGYGLPAMLSDLTDAVFEEDRGGSVNSIRQNLQRAYVERLNKMASGTGRYRHAEQAMAVYELQRIRKGLVTTNVDLSTKAHRTALKLELDRALSTDK